MARPSLQTKGAWVSDAPVGLASLALFSSPARLLLLVRSGAAAGRPGESREPGRKLDEGMEAGQQAVESV